MQGSFACQPTRRAKLRNEHVLVARSISFKQRYSTSVVRRPDSSIGIATRYGLNGPGIEFVYNEQARRKVVGARCSVDVAKCSESNS